MPVRVEDLDIYHIVRTFNTKLVLGVPFDEFDGEVDGMRLLIRDSTNRIRASQESSRL